MRQDTSLEQWFKPPISSTPASGCTIFVLRLPFKVLKSGLYGWCPSTSQYYSSMVLKLCLHEGVLCHEHCWFSRPRAGFCWNSLAICLHFVRTIGSHFGVLDCIISEYNGLTFLSRLKTCNEPAFFVPCTCSETGAGYWQVDIYNTLDKWSHKNIKRNNRRSSRYVYSLVHVCEWPCTGKYSSKCSWGFLIDTRKFCEIVPSLTVTKQTKKPKEFIFFFV